MSINTPLTVDERIDRVRSNIERYPPAIIPRLPAYNVAIKRAVISLCGYGPSLADTWGLTFGPLMTTSGAHDFMLSHDVVPDYHVECDPRMHKAWMIDEPHPKVHYLINSQCNANLFDKLLDKGCKVTMWHSYTDEDADRQIELVCSYEPGTRVLAGGTNVGMRAIVVAREMGYTRFELHGLDCCYYGQRQWAGSHMGAAHKSVRISVEGKEFETSDLMIQSTDDFINLLRMMPGCRFRVHGEGLLEARVRLLNADFQRAINKGWWSPINFLMKTSA